MVNQGLLGAIEQYFSVEDKPRLHKRNTFFEDFLNEHSLDEETAVCMGIITIVISLALIIWSMAVVL